MNTQLQQEGSPVLAEFYSFVQQDIEHEFLPFLQICHDDLSQNIDKINDLLRSEGRILSFDKPAINHLVLGIDSSSVTEQFGEVAIAIATGVIASSGNYPDKPKYAFKTLFGTNSETFGQVPASLRFYLDTKLLAETCNNPDPPYVFFDGSFQSLNFEANNFARRVMGSKEPPKGRRGRSQPIGRILEADLLIDFYDETFTTTANYFKIFNPYNSHFVAMSKRSVATSIMRVIEKARKEERTDVFIRNKISDKTILENILQAGEYTRPQKICDDESNFSLGACIELPSQEAKDEHDEMFKTLKFTYFKPHAWTTALRVEFSPSADLDKILSIVKAQTLTRTVLEPEVLFIADSLAKQAISVSSLYGELNLFRFPKLFKPSRSSKL